MEIRYTDNFPPPKFDLDAGIVAICNHCKATRKFRYQSVRDASEYDRFANDCIRTFGENHPCIEPGRTILIQPYDQEKR